MAKNWYVEYLKAYMRQERDPKDQTLAEAKKRQKAAVKEVIAANPRSRTWFKANGYLG